MGGFEERVTDVRELIHPAGRDLSRAGQKPILRRQLHTSSAGRISLTVNLPM